MEFSQIASTMNTRRLSFTCTASADVAAGAAGAASAAAAGVAGSEIHDTPVGVFGVAGGTSEDAV